MSNLKKSTILAAVTLLLSGIIMSCNSLSEPEQGVVNNGKGTVLFRITDAPFPADLVQEANVTVDWIKILKNTSVNPDEVPDNDEVIMVELEEPATYNLLALQNGVSSILAEVELPAGSYPEIRLHIVSAGILLKDGTAHALKVPGGDASGLKIQMEPELTVEEGFQSEVLFDFDLSRSFILRGNPVNNNGFIFKPVVRAVANVQTTAGTVSGVVADEDGYPVGNAALTLFKGEEEVTTALSSEDEGFFSFIGILPGNYTLVVEVNGYTDEKEIVVEAGVTTIQNFVVVAEEEQNSDSETPDEEEG